MTHALLGCAVLGKACCVWHAVGCVQVEVNEAEIEVLQSNVKRNKDPPPRARALHEINVRHKKHTERLEQVQRALMNDAVSVEQVDELKDSLEIYLVRSLPAPLCCVPRSLLGAFSAVSLSLPGAVLARCLLRVPCHGAARCHRCA